MPNPPRRLRTVGRRLWTTVHSQHRLTIHEGLRLARACEMADRVARLERLAAADAAGAAGPSLALLDDLNRARAELEAALREVGPVVHAGRLPELHAVSASSLA